MRVRASRPSQKGLALNIELIRIDRHNAALLGAVAAGVFDEPIVPERAAAYLADPAHLLILAMNDGQAIGMAMAVVHKHPDKPEELYVDEIGVAPEFRRRGVARLLMDAMVGWGQERGCTEAWLGTEIDNVAARALYRRYAKGQKIILYEWEFLDRG
jgi:ribosomal protein S18 acetylase RimI-like enzyme